MAERKQESKFILKVGGKEFNLKAFQSPRGIRHEDKRPNIIVVDCYQEFNVVEFHRYIDYLQTLASAMELRNH